MGKTLPTKFLDAKILRSIGDAELRARLLVEGMYASRHRCPYYGYSVEFVDHREYTDGDEPKMIDWKTYARTDRYFVKRFEMESNMNVLCMFDVSGSMGYRPADTGRMTKIEYGSYLIASICHLVSHQQDSPGLVTFDQDDRDFLPPRQGKRHLFTILSRFDGLEGRSGTQIHAVLRTIARRFKRRGIVVMVSDCNTDEDQVMDGVRLLRAQGHDVILLHLMDVDEIEFPFSALTAFRDMETGEQVISDPVRLRKTYLERFAKFRERIQTDCVAAGVDYRFISTKDPIELVLRDYLMYRRERSR
jgi:uncharacterized protein (DUF58 family)